VGTFAAARNRTGKAFRLFRSPDLDQWFPVATNVTARPVFEFEIPRNSADRQFYKAVQGP
jgi:hypothetical protein